MQPLLPDNRSHRFIERRSQLTLLCILCFACLWFWGWLNQAATYGGFHLTFKSPALGINFEAAYRNHFIYYSSPEQGCSGKVPIEYFAALKRKYGIYAAISVFNIFFLLALYIVYKLFKLLKTVFGVPDIKFLILRILKLFVLITFAASIFRWGDIQFSQPVAAADKLSPIGAVIYDIFQFFILDIRHTFIYSCLFELPLLILKWIAWGSLSVLVVAWFRLPEAFSRKLDGLVESVDKISLSRLAATIGIVTFILANIISWFKFHHLPLLPEAIGQVFQARIFGSGQLSAPATHSPEFFAYPFLETIDTWYSQFPPGYSLLLTPWVKLSLAWLYNPLLGLLVIFLFYQFSLSAYGNRTAILGLILLGMSGAFIKICGDITPALTQATAVLGMMYFYQRGMGSSAGVYPRQSEGGQSPALLTQQNMTGSREWDFLYSGLCGGLSLLISPKLGFVWLIPVVLHLCCNSRICRIALFTAVLIPGTAILMTYNLHQLGQWLKLGLGPMYASPIGRLWHSPWQGFKFICHQFHEFQWKIWGWLPGLFLLVLWIIVPGERLAWDKLLLGGLLGLVAIHMVWFNPYPGLGNIFWAALPFFVLLTARSIQSLPRQLEGIGIPFQPMRDLVILLTAFLLFGSTWRFFYDLIIREAPPNPAFQITAQLKQSNTAKAIVFMKEEDYLPSFAANLPDLSNPIIFARNLSKSNLKLVQEFPQYRYYSYTPDQGLKEL